MLKPLDETTLGIFVVSVIVTINALDQHSFWNRQCQGSEGVFPIKSKWLSANDRTMRLTGGAGWAHGANGSWTWTYDGNGSVSKKLQQELPSDESVSHLKRKRNAKSEITKSKKAKGRRQNMSAGGQPSEANITSSNPDRRSELHPDLMYLFGMSQHAVAPPPPPKWIPADDDLDLPDELALKPVSAISNLTESNASVTSPTNADSGATVTKATDPILADMDKEILASIRALQATGGISAELMSELQKEGFTEVASMPRSPMHAVNDVLGMPPTALAICGSSGARDALGRFPPWLPSISAGAAATGNTTLAIWDRAGAHALALRNPTAVAAEREAVVPPAVTDLSGRWGPMAIFHPAYGRKGVSFAVRIPRPLLDAAGSAGPAGDGGGGVAVRRKYVMTALGQVWRDRSLEEWPAGDCRLFIGDLGQHATDRDLTEALRGFPGFNMARVARDRRRGLCRGYGFASFATAPQGDAVIRHQRLAAARAAAALADAAGGPADAGWAVGARRGAASRLAQICVRGRPVVVKRSKWEKRVLTAETMPAAVELRRRRDEAVAQGRLDPDRMPTRNRALRRALRRAGAEEVPWAGSEEEGPPAPQQQGELLYID